MTKGWKVPQGTYDGCSWENCARALTEKRPYLAGENRPSRSLRDKKKKRSESWETLEAPPFLPVWTPRSVSTHQPGPTGLFRERPPSLASSQPRPNKAGLAAAAPPPPHPRAFFSLVRPGRPPSPAVPAGAAASQPSKHRSTEGPQQQQQHRQGLFLSAAGGSPRSAWAATVGGQAEPEPAFRGSWHT